MVRKYNVGHTHANPANWQGSARMGASVKAILMSQRVLYPPPQAVPLLPHGRRLFSAVGACEVGSAVGSECVRYSHKPASSPSSTAVAVPLLPHGRRLFEPLALVG